MPDEPLLPYMQGSYEIRAAHTSLRPLVSTHDTSLKRNNIL